MLRPPTQRFFAYAMILTLVGSLFSLVLPAVQSYASHENITVNIVDDVDEVFSPDDSIAIEGTIDDVQVDEDVTIRILNPGGSEEEEDNVTPDEDDGYFDFPYDIPSDADGGIWTVEVTYDGDEAFSYFMVEYDEDDVAVITVDLDAADGIYQAEDTVEIEGTVDEEDPNEEFVRIIVLDPANGELVDDDEVELNNDDFTFDFDLDDAHGRYAVLVTYADQEGAAVLEIEDEGTGSNDDDDLSEDAVTEGSDGDLSAEIDDEIYDQSGTVVVTGEINNYDDTEELGISIRDPDNTEIEADDDVSVDEDGSDGTFEFEYDIDDDADEGLYTITITYDSDEVELAFGVEEGSGGGSGGSGELTIKLTKSAYLAGETMTVSGTVDEVADPEDGELLSVFIYMPEGQVILAGGSSKYVEPSSNGAYSATITLPSDLEEDEEYTVKVSYLDETVEANFAITGVSSTPADEISVETDEDEYEIGSTVEISGEVPDTMIVEGQQLLIRVNKPDGNPCRIDPIALPASGSYAYELVLGGTCGVAGEYKIEVTYGDNEADTSFELVGSSSSSYSLNVEGNTYPIEYELTGGAINGMSIPKNQDDSLIPKLVIRMIAEEDGQLTMMLPREVIDAIKDGEDIDFVVSVEDADGNISVVDVEESGNTDDARTLVIEYPAGAERIEIAGTQVVPEFGAIAAIVMAIAIVGIIVATARFNKPSFFRQ